MTAGDGYQCSNEPILSVGIGNVASIDNVLVQWPSGFEATYHDVDVNRRYVCAENEAAMFVDPATR